MNTNRRHAVAALIAAGLLWGTTVPLSKLALEWLSPGWLTAARFGLAAAVLLAAARRSGGQRAALRAAFTPAVLVAGALGYGGSVMVQNAGILRTSVTHAALLIGAVPVLVAVIAAAWHRTVARPVAWFGFVVSLGGVGLVAGGGGGGATLAGDGLVLVSLLLSAAVTVAQGRLLAGRDPVAVTAVQFLGAALGALLVTLCTSGAPAAPGGPGPVLAVAALAAAGTLLPFTLFAFGQSRVSAEVAGAFLNLEPLVGAVAGVVVFGDPFGLAQVAGGAAILAGIGLSSLPLLAGRRRRPRATGITRSPRSSPLSTVAATSFSPRTWAGARPTGSGSSPASSTGNCSAPGRPPRAVLSPRRTRMPQRQKTSPGRDVTSHAAPSLSLRVRSGVYQIGCRGALTNVRQSSRPEVPCFPAGTKDSLYDCTMPVSCRRRYRTITRRRCSGRLPGHNWRRSRGNGDGPVKFHTARRSAAWRLFLTLTLIVSGAGIVAACNSNPPKCGGDTQAYNGNCLSITAITYIECTKDRGFDISSQIGGGIGGTFRSIAGVSLSLAAKKTKQEDTPVALQIVHDCLTVAQQRSQAAADRGTAQDYLQQTDRAIQDWQQTQVAETPHIKLDKSSAAIGETVTVSGKSFWPNETIDITVHATLVKQVQADSKGAFTTEITVPASVPPPDFQTTITASGETSAKSADAPFHSAG